jgi:tRNA (cytosine38-C5)-methyltransferase
MLMFEFFSGVGGMHQAISSIESVKIDKVYPFDINPNANVTYHHNFGVKPFEISLESFSLSDYESICKENNTKEIIWLMSPPCQPFTRQGNSKDLNDDRTNGFKNIISILNQTSYLPEFLLLENVKNFEVK